MRTATNWNPGTIDSAASTRPIPDLPARRYDRIASPQATSRLNAKVSADVQGLMTGSSIKRRSGSSQNDGSACNGSPARR
jgi:hypothetical protein